MFESNTRDVSDLKTGALRMQVRYIKRAKFGEALMVLAFISNAKNNLSKSKRERIRNLLQDEST